MIHEWLASAEAATSFLHTTPSPLAHIYLAHTSNEHAVQATQPLLGQWIVGTWLNADAPRNPTKKLTALLEVNKKTLTNLAMRGTVASAR